MTSVRSLVAPALAIVLTVGLSTAPVSAADEPAPTVEIKPGSLKRGDDVRLPHLEGRTLVDGDLRIEIDAPSVRYVGTSARDYLVQVAKADGTSNSRVKRVTPAGKQSVVLRGLQGAPVRVSTNGRSLAVTSATSAERTVVTVYDARTGERTARRAFGGSVSVLDFTGARMLLGGTSPARTLMWAARADRIRLVMRYQGYAGTIAGDRLATYDRDPYAGGCSATTKISNPKVQLWLSCRQRVALFSPTGRRVATVPLLSDGVGPDTVRVLASRGRALARYSIQGWFADLRWEDDAQLLLDSNGKKVFAVVRCVKDACKRASDVEPARSPRT